VLVNREAHAVERIGVMAFRENRLCTGYCPKQRKLHQEVEQRIVVPGHPHERRYRKAERGCGTHSSTK
jgi:hypothetical protein